MRVVVIGSGNVGSAYAGELALSGFDVVLLKTTRNEHDAHFERTREAGGIVVREIDGSERFAPLKRVTREPKTAFERPADAIVVATQTHGRKRIAEMLEALDVSARLLILTPGYLTSVCFYKTLRGRIEIVAEGESPAFDARIAEPGVVRICFKNVRNALAFLPRAKTDPGLEIARALVSTYGYARTCPIESALHNPNLILHTIGCVTSAARIETARGDFQMYREGFTPSVCRLIERLDAEKKNVLRAYGREPISYWDACLFRNEIDLTKDPREVFRQYGENGGPKGPDRLDSRYLTEDAPNGLGVMIALAERRGVETRFARAVMTLAEGLLGVEFGESRRVWERLGVSFEELIRIVEE